MATRRAVTISLPASDLRSATILDWLERQPAQSDVSGELRGLLVQALGSYDRLSGIERKLDALLGEIRSGNFSMTGKEPSEEQLIDAEFVATVDRLLLFDT